MLIEPTPLPDLLVLTPRLLRDGRGFFAESYNQRAFAEATGADLEFVQDLEAEPILSGKDAAARRFERRRCSALF